MPIYRPELVAKANRKALRAAAWSRRLNRGGMRPLEQACAELHRNDLVRAYFELMRLAHCPRPEPKAYEGPFEWLSRMVQSGQMTLAAPASIPSVELPLAKAA